MIDYGLEFKLSMEKAYKLITGRKSTRTIQDLEENMRIIRKIRRLNQYANWLLDQHYKENSL
jgi:hypothetical protein